LAAYKATSYPYPSDIRPSLTLKDGCLLEKSPILGSATVRGAPLNISPASNNNTMSQYGDFTETHV
jgi:hypothetical protein